MFIPRGSVLYTAGNASTPQLLLKQLARDKSIRSIELIMKELADAVIEGKGQRAMEGNEPEPPAAAAPTGETGPTPGQESAEPAPAEEPTAEASAKA